MFDQVYTHLDSTFIYYAVALGVFAVMYVGTILAETYGWE